MIARKRDLGRYGCRILTRSDQGRVGARAERQAQCVEQDGLARPGLAGEHAETRLELQLEPLDEHDIVDGELPQHGARLGVTCARRSAAGPVGSRVRAAAAIGCTSRTPGSSAQGPLRPSALPPAYRAPDSIRLAARALRESRSSSGTGRLRCGTGMS